MLDGVWQVDPRRRRSAAPLRPALSPGTGRRRSKNFLAAWAKIEAPVLVVYGEFDQFEPRDGHQLIADTVNQLRPGTATFVEIANGVRPFESCALPGRIRRLSRGRRQARATKLLLDADARPG